MYLSFISCPTCGVLFNSERLTFLIPDPRQSWNKYFYCPVCKEQKYADNPEDIEIVRFDED